MKKNIAILGSTGSIGTQALEVIAANPDRFQVEVLTAHSNADLLIRQAVQFNPNLVVIEKENQYEKVKAALSPLNIKVYTGQQALIYSVENENIDIVLTALVGFAGLLPTIQAIKAKKTIALANKETLVVAGHIIMPLAAQCKVPIIPVDSEHSAIFQCLAGELSNPIEKIVLTASGGPFRRKTKNELASVTKQQALSHPNWSMGSKITVDSATLMNKGLEIIEAKWLFNIKPEQIEVIIHPESIIHSMVQFEDGSVKAQMGLPDMKLPIQYALGFPERIPSEFPRLLFKDYPSLSFEAPDFVTFRSLTLAFESLKKGGNHPCILNAANEVAVEAFLQDKIGFLKISDIVEETLEKIAFIANPNLEQLLKVDSHARNIAKALL